MDRSELSRLTASARLFVTAAVLILLAGLPGCGPSGSTSHPIVLTTESGGRLRILFGGDTYFGDTYSLVPVPNGVDLPTNPSPTDLGYDRPLSALRPLLNSADAVVVNLETPLSTLTISPHDGNKRFLHRGEPTASTAALRSMGVVATSLANNHTLDDGPAGLVQTIRALRRADIVPFGAGDDRHAAARPVILELSDGDTSLTVAIIAGFSWREDYDEEYAWFASDDHPGAHAWDPSTAVSQIHDVHRAHPNAYILAFPHWGRNYAWADDDQEEFATLLVNAGVDLVLGHGAHTVQEIEPVAGQWVCYNLGNFVFLSPGRYVERETMPFSLAAAVDVAFIDHVPALHLRLYPLHTDNRTNGYQPRPVTGDEFTELHGALLRRSTSSSSLLQQLRVKRDSIGWHFEVELPTHK